MCESCNEENSSSYNSVAKNPNNPVKSGAEHLNRLFSREDIQRAGICMPKIQKRYSASLIIRGMQIKATVKYHLRPARMAIIKKTKNQNC